jgi:hypothetical protein
VAALPAPVRVDLPLRPAELLGAAENPAFEGTFDPPSVPL